MDSVQTPGYLEVLLSPCCTILKVCTFIVGGISCGRLDTDMDVDMDKNGITDGSKLSLQFITQLNTNHEGVTLKMVNNISRPL